MVCSTDRRYIRATRFAWLRMSNSLFIWANFFSPSTSKYQRKFNSPYTHKTFCSFCKVWMKQMGKYFKSLPSPLYRENATPFETRRQNLLSCLSNIYVIRSLCLAVAYSCAVLRWSTPAKSSHVCLRFVYIYIYILVRDLHLSRQKANTISKMYSETFGPNKHLRVVSSSNRDAIQFVSDCNNSRKSRMRNCPWLVFCVVFGCFFFVVRVRCRRVS